MDKMEKLSNEAYAMAKNQSANSRKETNRYPMRLTYMDNHHRDMRQRSKESIYPLYVVLLERNYEEYPQAQ